jgi:hypothetical protein
MSCIGYSEVIYVISQPAPHCLRCFNKSLQERKTRGKEVQHGTWQWDFRDINMYRDRRLEGIALPMMGDMLDGDVSRAWD